MGSPEWLTGRGRDPVYPAGSSEGRDPADPAPSESVLCCAIALVGKKKEDAPFASITKHQEHPPGTMARLRESDALPIEAQRHKDRIEKDSAQRPTKQCAKCASQCFHRHQKRLRWFLAVVEQVVRPLRCLLYRWRCVNCGTTFTHLPALCVPFKRFLRSEIEERAQTYVETDPTSYRRVVKERGSAVVYDDPIADSASTEAEREEESTRALAPSTVHRWIGSIAAGREQWQPAVRLAQQLPADRAGRTLVIMASKYRSQARKCVLEACGLLLRAISLLAGRNPTRLATLGSSP